MASNRNRNKKRKRKERRRAQEQKQGQVAGPGRSAEPDTEPDWTQECEVCGATPVVGDLGLCGPCCFGEAETAGGNW